MRVHQKRKWRLRQIKDYGSKNLEKVVLTAWGGILDQL